MNKPSCLPSNRLFAEGNKDNEAKLSLFKMNNVATFSSHAMAALIGQAFKLRSLRSLLLNSGVALALSLALAPSFASAQSIWRDDSKTMFGDKRGVGVGDILTIVVQENTTTSKDNKTATSRKAEVDASISSFLYSPGASSLLTKGGQLPAMNFNSKNDFSGGGTIANSEKMIARIAVKIVDVLPNKNFVIEGKRETSFSSEKQTMILRGIVREADVLGNNTVYSYNVADATIQITSKGAISDSQRKGWFTRVWDKLSPF